ncbi:MAG: sedoheptulose 7-phosphate cyclase [Egibacteraceae bacterium]
MQLVGHRDSDFKLAPPDAPPRAWRVATYKQVSYGVQMVDGLFDIDDDPELLRVGRSAESSTLRRFVVLDATVDAFYGDRIQKYFQHHGVDHRILTLAASEPAKTMDAVFAVAEGLDAFGVARRHEPIIGIGGGVLLDIVGLAASLYRRSTPYIRVPTTLIGLVDAGIGAKTGVNFHQHKNRLGTYFPSMMTFLDRRFLETLDVRHICNGLAEILKIALVKDLRLFELLESHGARLIEERLQGHTEVGDAAAEEVLYRAIQGMLEELEPNLWEHKLERVVDYGHSFSPTIEMQALPELLHGEAVAIDMALSTILACQRGFVTPKQRDRIFAVMHQLRLPVSHRLCTPELLQQALEDTVRHRDGLQRLPLPVGIGAAYFVNDLTQSELTSAVAQLRELGGNRD